jgi:hypothetical protein
MRSAALAERLLDGVRQWGGGRVGAVVGGRDPHGCSDAEHAREAGRRSGKAVSSVHDRSQAEAHDGPWELDVRPG